MPLYRIAGRLVLFVHVPKTGGTSVDRWLSAAGQGMLGAENQPRWLPSPPQHLHAAALAALVPAGMPDLAFAIVREPEARIVSEFFHRHRHDGRCRRIGLWQRRRPLAELSPGALSSYFDAWLRRGFARADRDPWWDQNHLRPQAEFTDWPGLRVFRLEDGMAPVLGWLAGELGLPIPEVPHENRSRRQALALAPATRAAIRARYAEDYARWYPEVPEGALAASADEAAGGGGGGMRVAVATGTWRKLSETFVNRHVAHLFGGAACVVANRCSADAPPVPPLALRRNRGFAPVASLAALVSHASLAPPRGAVRERVEALLRAEGVEAILAEFGSEAVALGPVAAALGLPLFTYFRGYDASKDLRSPLRRAAYRRLMPQLAGAFAVSRFLLDNLARHGIRPPRAEVIPSGVDMALFRPGPKRPQSFLAVGRLVEKKAPDLTVAAFCQAARGYPGAVLELIGEGPLEARCRAVAEAAGMAGQVLLHGAQPHDFVRERLAGAEVFLQHSVTTRDRNTEGLPTAIQEAMACGAVTISTRHAGIPEAIDEGETGWLVAERDVAGFAARIAAVLAGGAPAAMGARARAVAEARFDNGLLLARLEARMTDWAALDRAARQGR